MATVRSFVEGCFVCAFSAAMLAASAAGAQTVVPTLDVNGYAIMSPTVLPASFSDGPAAAPPYFVPLGQNNGGWCFLASSEMVLSYYGYAVSQCEMADQCRVNASGTECGDRNGATNIVNGCCPSGAPGNPSGTKCSNGGGWEGSVLGYYGLGETQALLTFDSATPSFVNQIDLGIPVVLGVNLTDAGHVMVVSGYATNSNGDDVLLLNDPDAYTVDLPAGAYDNPSNDDWSPGWGGPGMHGFFCPAEQNPCWITWTQYLCACSKEDGGTCTPHSTECAGPMHTRQAELHSFKAASPLCTTDYFDQSSATVDRCATSAPGWLPQGYNPTAITQTMSGSSMAYSGSYLFPPPNTAVNAMQIGLSESAYASWIATEEAQSPELRPSQVSVVSTGGDLDITVLATPYATAEVPGSAVSFPQLTEAELWSYVFGQYSPANGYVLVDLYAYSDESFALWVAATWVKMSTTPSAPPIPVFVTSQDYQSVFDQYTGDGWTLLRASAYATDGTGDTSLVTLWAQTYAPFFNETGLSPAELSAQNLYNYQTGYTLSYLSALDDTYCAIWTAPNPAP